MISISMGQSTHSSILDTIIAANYDEYAEQRFQLQEVFARHPRFVHHHNSPTPPPPASPPPADPVPPPPPPRKSKSQPSDSKQPPPPSPPEAREKMSKAQKKQIASKERASRLRRLRPDIRSVPNSISNDQALSLGGYKSQSDMDKDLLSREKGLSSEDSR